MDKLATVDVLLPVYNCEQFIKEALRSILNQTYSVQYIYVLDDCSQDTTTEKVKSFKDSRIKLLTTDKNQGIVFQLNRGIKLSTSDYIARMDGDDISFPKRIEQQVQFMENNPDHIACSGGFYSIDQNQNLIKKVKLSNKPNNPYLTPAHQHFLQHPFLMVRSQALKAVYGYKNVQHCEDADLYYRLEEHGLLYNLDSYLGKYRIHSGSISSISRKNNLTQALHSQLMAIHLRRGKKYNYLDSLPSSFESDLNMTDSTIESFMELATLSLQLTQEEVKWLHLAFPIKFLQNIYNRQIVLTKKDYVFFKKLPYYINSSELNDADKKKVITQIIKFFQINKKEELSCIRKIYLHYLNYKYIIILHFRK